MHTRNRCDNDNHGRMVVRVRWCPSCGNALNSKIAAMKCTGDTHARMRRARNSYCTNCGTSLNSAS